MAAEVLQTLFSRNQHSNKKKLVKWFRTITSSKTNTKPSPKFLRTIAALTILNTVLIVALFLYFRYSMNNVRSELNTKCAPAAGNSEPVADETSDVVTTAVDSEPLCDNKENDISPYAKRRLLIVETKNSPASITPTVLESALKQMVLHLKDVWDVEFVEEITTSSIPFEKVAQYRTVKVIKVMDTLDESFEDKTEPLAETLALYDESVHVLKKKDVLVVVIDNPPFNDAHHRNGYELLLFSLDPVTGGFVPAELERRGLYLKSFLLRDFAF